MARRQANSSRRKSAGERRKGATAKAGWSLLGLVPQARQLLADNRPAVDFLGSQLRSLREVLESQVENPLKRLEQRIDSLLCEVEERTARRLEPVLARAEVVRKQDLRPLEHRLGRLEERLARTVEEQNRLAICTAQIERQGQVLRIDTSERLAEWSERLAELEALRVAVTELRQGQDKLAKEGVGRAVEAAKFSDRLVRLETRSADIARECDSLAAAARDLGQRLTVLAEKLAQDVAKAAGTAEEVAMMRADVEDLIHRVSGLSDLQQANRCELDRVSSLLRNRENSLEARLADIVERQRRAGAELASLTGKLLELEKLEPAAKTDPT